VQCDDLLVGFGQREKIAASELPKRSGAVLDREGIIGGHHRFQRGEVGQHGCGAGELAFALTLNALERADGGLGAVPDLAIGFDADGVADDEEKSARQPANDQERGKEELRS
jgi:hypothetical protein